MPQPIVEQIDEYPNDGQLVFIRGMISTDYLDRGEIIPVAWSPFWEAMTEAGYVRPMDEQMIPDAMSVFPTIQQVIDMISAGATTLPGQRILDVRGDDTGLWVRVGTSEEASREFRVDWPSLDEVLSSIREIRDETKEYADDPEGAVQAAVGALRAELVSYNGIASSAAEVALDAAEDSVSAATRAEQAAASIEAKTGIGFGDVVATYTSGDFRALDLNVAGLYRIRGGTGYVTNMPVTTAGLWWNLILLDTADTGGANTKLFLAHSATSNVIYACVKYGATWGAWAAINAAAPGSMTLATATAATPATTSVLISPAVLQQAIRTYLTGSSSGVPTAIGQQISVAADAAAVRALIGAGTSDLSLGTTADTAKAGNYTPTWGEVSGKPTTFTPATHQHVATEITDSTATGRSVLTAATQAAARTAIGAGTSNLAIGTTASTAKAGNYTPTWTEVSGKPTAFPPETHQHAVADIPALNGKSIQVVSALPGSPDPNTIYFVTG